MPPQPTPNNSEINEALKEFEAKSGEGQPNGDNHIQGVITPQNPVTPSNEVEGVTFNTDTEVESYRAIKFYRETVEPKMVKAVIKSSGGIVKTQKQAEYVLLGLVVVAMGLSVYLFFWVGMGLGHTQPKITPAMMEQMKNEIH